MNPYNGIQGIHAASLIGVGVVGVGVGVGVGMGEEVMLPTQSPLHNQQNFLPYSSHSRSVFSQSRSS
jgi:hypothetical protein